MPHRERPLIVRCAYGAFGAVCVVVGFVGIVTPVMPGFVFLVIALWAFRKLRTKIIALCMIWLAISLTCYKIYTSARIYIKQIDWTMPKWIPLLILVGPVIWLTDYVRRVPLAAETSEPKTL